MSQDTPKKKVSLTHVIKIRILRQCVTVGATSKVHMATSDGTQIRQDTQYAHNVTFSRNVQTLLQWKSNN